MSQPADATRLERILGLLRADGGRITPARRAVVDALLAGPDHQSADAIAETVQTALPDVSVSTIYRILDALERVGEVEHMHLGHGPSLYHLADRRHGHLLCRRCDRVFDLPDRSLEALAAELAERQGFTLEPDHFALLGTCADCAAGPSA